VTTGGAGLQPGERPVRYVDHVMGMPISLALRGRHAGDERGRAAWSRVMASLRAADAVFSTYRAASVIRRLDRGEIALADCPPEVAAVLDLGAAAERDSGGAFSVRRPDADGRMTLDPSGVVKGWAAERAAGELRVLAGTDFCLSAGGDLVCRTLDPDAPPWRIGIEDPRDPSRLVAVVPIASGAVATSGTAHRGAHLVDARTGRAPDGIASVTVVADSLTDADIDATAAYAQGREAADWLRTRPGRSGLVVWADGSTTSVPDADPRAAVSERETGAAQ
jgi:thiamine biosynthesis lipoprotein